VQLPVEEALRTLGRPTLWIACQHRVADALVRAGRQPIDLTKELRGTIAKAASDASAAAAQLHGEPGVDLPVSSELDRFRFVDYLRDQLQQHLPLAYRATALAAVVVERVQPEVLVVGNDLTVEGRAGCIASAGEVPTACLMHGLVKASNPLHGRHIADGLLLFGEQQRRALSQLGIKKAALRVCGDPGLDRPPHQSARTDPRVCALWRDRLPTTPWVLVAFSGPGNSVSHEHHRGLVKAVVMLASEVPTVPVVAKLHRKDGPREWLEHSGGTLPENLYVVEDGMDGRPTSIFDWLQGCSLVVTGASFVAVEAMLMGVPVLTVDLASELEDVDFIRSGATIHVRAADRLVEEVAHLLSSGPPPALRGLADDYVHDMYAKTGGGAALRCAETVLSLRRRITYSE
jgi:hypothetical protein